MAMMETFLPHTNTFNVTNREIGFTLKEIKDITGLPILRELYEEFVPTTEIPSQQSPTFQLGYLQVIAMFDYIRQKTKKKKRSKLRGGSN